MLFCHGLGLLEARAPGTLSPFLLSSGLLATALVSVQQLLTVGQFALVYGVICQHLLGIDVNALPKKQEEDSPAQLLLMGF